MITLRLFLAWLTGHFDIRFIFTPFATKNIVPPVRDKGSFIGYTDVFIFGIRIVRIQRTKGWRTIEQLDKSIKKALTTKCRYDKISNHSLN